MSVTIQSGKANTASSTTFTPAGSIAATNVQTAIEELDTEKQPVDADLTSWASVTRASGFDTFTATPSSANLISLLTDETGTGSAVFATAPTITEPVWVGTPVEDIYTITDGAAFAIDPANGGIQKITLGASRTPTASGWTSGQEVLLKIDDGTAYTITWTTIGVVWVGGSAPTLATSGFSWVVLWLDGSTYYGKYIGDTAT